MRQPNEIKYQLDQDFLPDTTGGTVDKQTLRSYANWLTAGAAVVGAVLAGQAVEHHQAAVDKAQASTAALLYELQHAYKDPHLTGASIENSNPNAEIIKLRIEASTQPNEEVAEDDTSPNFSYNTPVAAVHGTQEAFNSGSGAPLERAGKTSPDGTSAYEVDLSRARLGARGGVEQVDVFAAATGVDPQGDKIYHSRDYMGTVTVDDTNGQLQVTLGRRDVLPQQDHFMHVEDISS